MTEACHPTNNYLIHTDHGSRKYRRVAVCPHPSVFSYGPTKLYFRLVPDENPISENFFQRKLVRPIVDLLKQGVTPEKLAVSAALGVVLGIFPVIGSTTTLCAIAAFALRLNLPAIQIVNYFMYPAQIALLIPFLRLGEKLFRV